MADTTKIIHLRRLTVTGEEGIEAILSAIKANGGETDRIRDSVTAKSFFERNKKRPVVIATDNMLLEDDDLRAAAVEFVRNGGTIVAMWPFAAPYEAIEKALEAFGLSWKTDGNYHRDEFTLNPRFNHFNISKLGDYSMQCGLLKEVPTQDCLYVKALAKHSAIAQKLLAESVELTQDEVAAAFTKIKEGYFGYVGDEGKEAETADVLLAILGLL